MQDSHPQFIHLRLHSEYSIQDSVVRLAPLLDQACKDSVPALALTDHTNCFAFLKFYTKCLRAGIKPIIGSDVWITHAACGKPQSRCTLLCLDRQGYYHLKCLLSKAYTDGQQSGQPVVHWDWLQEYAAGLLVLSGGVHGDIGQALLADDLPRAQECLERWHKYFPQRFYLEVHRLGWPGEARYIQAVAQLAQATQTPVVATNLVCFMQPDDFDAHEARVCIQRSERLDDAERSRLHTREQYFKTAAQMQHLFADLPSALQNTVEIAKRCNVQLTLGQHFLPSFPTPKAMSEADYLAQQARKGLEERFADNFQFPAGKELSDYETRLAIEIKVIANMGFPGYFLIVADFIQWSKQQNIPVGPGRGSGAGSLVAYALKITELDPLRYDLLFERFLNPERVSLPDFDIDFCMDRRDEVIEYVAQRYGRDCVSQIITYGSMAAKAVVRDVGRVQGLPYGLCDGIAKLVPFELGITLHKALEQEEPLKQRYTEESEVKDLIDMAQKLEGLTRNAGKHAGGVVIAPKALTHFAPLYCEAGSAQAVIQFDKDDAETIGLVKFDFLGLRTLTIISWAVDAINQRRAAEDLPAININHIDMHDDKVFALMAACQTVAVFQLESRGMRDLVRRLKPDCFDDMIALVALFRPGPLQSGMVDDFIKRKHGEAPVIYPHPCLEGVLAPTYGIILYQEQVMQIAQIFSGYSLGAADLLRRAMGKKKPEEMAKQRQSFVDGAVANDKDAKLAADLFDLIEKFAGYGFNKSHSAAYALLSYQTAWLKSHYPAEFMAAVLSSDMDNTDKLVGFVNEVRSMQLELRGVDINLSEYYFKVNAAGEIVYGLGAVKGVGEGAVAAVIAERQSGGDYTSLFDICSRVELQKLNKRALEPLIYSGAFDSLKVNRATLLANCPAAMRWGESKQQERSHGQGSLFDLFDQDQKVSPQLQYKAQDPWLLEDRLQYEFQALGLYFSSHPLAGYAHELRQVTQTIAAALHSSKKIVAVAGLLVACRILRTKKDKPLAVMTLSDQTGSIDVTAFSEVLETARPILVKGQIVVVKGELGDDSFSGGKKILAKKIITLDEVRQRCVKRLIIHMRKSQADAKQLPLLADTLRPFQGGSTEVFMRYYQEGYAVDLRFGPDWRVTANGELLKKILQLYGDASAVFEYN